MTALGTTPVWTPEKDETFKRMWEAGELTETIAIRLRVSEDALKNRRAKLGLPARRQVSRFWEDPENVETLKRLWHKGLSASQVAEKMGIKRNQVIGKVYRLGISGEDRPKRKRVGRPRKPAKVTLSKTVKAAPANADPIEKWKAEHQRKQRLRELAHANGFAGDVQTADLKHDHCRWLHDDGSYCGKFRKRGSYCEQHAKEVYQPVRRDRTGKLMRNPVWRIG